MFGFSHKKQAPVAIFRRHHVIFQYKLIHSDAKVPTQSRDTDAAYDVYTIDAALIEPGTMVNLHTGIRLACPDGWYYTTEGRSGLNSKFITPLRGVIDASFNGELRIILCNFSKVPYQVSKGDRVAQIIAHEMNKVTFKQVEEFSPEYDMRGIKGWGSTGK